MGIKPELLEDTNLDQVTLVMKMEKESDDESAEKSADSKNESNRFIRKAEADFSLYGCWG